MVKIPCIPKDSSLAGTIKTRLVPPLTNAEATGLYSAFLSDIFNTLACLKNVDIHIFFTPSGDGVDTSTLTKLVPSNAVLTPQKGTDLGERMKNAFSLLFSKRYARVAVIGSDSPDIPLKFIEKAFEELDLDQGSLILGPATDGGYYLIAMGRLHPAVFDGVKWSTPQVLSQTLERAKSAEIKVHLLKQWYDIDIPEDLEKLRNNKAAPCSAIFMEKISKNSKVD